MARDRGTVLAMKRFLLLAVTALGCSSSSEDEEFTYGRADVEAALVGKWTGSFASGRTGTIELNLALAAPGAQTKCANRTLSLKCMTESTAALTGTLTTSDGQLQTVPVTGTIMIGGTTFNNGYVSISTSAGVNLNAMYEAGTLKNGTLSASGATSTFTLTRAK
jgi:hypothetical protein